MRLGRPTLFVVLLPFALASGACSELAQKSRNGGAPSPGLHGAGLRTLALKATSPQCANFAEEKSALGDGHRLNVTEDCRRNLGVQFACVMPAEAAPTPRPGVGRFEAADIETNPQLLADFIEELGRLRTGALSSRDATMEIICHDRPCDCEDFGPGFSNVSDPRFPEADCAYSEIDDSCFSDTRVTLYEMEVDENGECYLVESEEQRNCQHDPEDPENDGCFDPLTRITMADQTTKLIGAIRVGDSVWNPVLKRGQKVARKIAGPELLPMYEIHAGSGSVKVTSLHPMRTDRGIVAAAEVRPGDLLYRADLAPEKVTRVTNYLLSPADQVVNLELESVTGTDDDHWVVADGLVTGDHFLQKKLERDRVLGGANIPRGLPRFLAAILAWLK